MKGGLRLGLSCAPVDGVILLSDNYTSRPAIYCTLQQQSMTNRPITRSILMLVSTFSHQRLIAYSVGGFTHPRLRSFQQHLSSMDTVHAPCQEIPSCRDACCQCCWKWYVLRWTELTFRIQYHNVRLGPDRADDRTKRVLPEIHAQCHTADLEPGLVTLWSGKYYVCE